MAKRGKWEDLGIAGKKALVCAEFGDAYAPTCAVPMQDTLHAKTYCLMVVPTPALSATHNCLAKHLPPQKDLHISKTVQRYKHKENLKKH